MTHIKDLVPDPANRRAHNPRNLGMVVDALQQVGAARSIVIDEDNVILAGNGVSEAAAEAGITKVQVVDVDGSTLVAVRRTGLSAEQKRALAIYDNRTAELAEWNFEQLQADVAAGLSLQPFWSAEEEAALLAKSTAGKEGLTDPDAVPEQRATDIKLGDLFQLGAHRLLCGDSTSEADVARLMDGEKAGLVYTDPPYGVDYDGGTKIRAKLAGDSGTQLYGPACQMAALHSDDKAALYLWHAGIKGIAAAAAAAAAAAGYEIRCELVWNKNQAQFGALSAQYKQKHEPAYYCFKKGKAPRWFGPTNEVTVWDCDRASVNEFHPTQKPVALAERAIRNSLDPSGLMLDLFLGSGATLIAAATTGRTCYGLELEPSYCQVILDRWEAFTGQQAQKLGEVVHASA